VTVRVARIQVVMIARETARAILSGSLASIPRTNATTAATAAVRSILPRELTAEA
jgi:hypothetical protein